MGLILWLLAILILGIFILLFFIIKGFKNPVTPHQVPENLPFQINEVFIPTIKNKKLYAWWIPVDESAPTLIFIHGWGRNAQRMMSYLNTFCCKGFNLLAFDARSHGNSDADGYTNMLKFAEDISAAADYANQKTKNKDIYLIGLSIGGAASIYAAAKDKRIKKVATVGAFAHPATVMINQLKQHHIPYFPVIWLFFQFIRIFQKLDLDAIAPVNNIASAESQFLIIHGKEDRVVPVSEGIKLKEAAGTKAELWIIPNKGHSDCHFEKGFWDRLFDFFQIKNTKQ